MTGRRPDDAAAFIASVERATNERVVEAASDIFAANARWVAITDGARQESLGIGAIDDAWAQACATFKARHFTVRKRLLAATEDTIVNDWRGGPRGRNHSHGIEVWRFDLQGKVIELRAYSFLNVRSPFHPVQTLQLLLGSPAMTLTGGLARLRHRPARSAQSV